MLVGQREKSRKYFDLSTFNYNLTDSNPCSSLGVMNFQKWELFFLAHPVVKLTLNLETITATLMTCINHHVNNQTILSKNYINELTHRVGKTSDSA